MRFCPSSGGHVATTLIAIVGSGLISLHAAASPQDDTTATANGGVSLDVSPHHVAPLTLRDPETDDTPDAAANAAPDDTAPASDTTNTNEDEPVDIATGDAEDSTPATPSWQPPERESQGLGTPRNIFELGNTDTNDVASEDAEGAADAFSILDPRKNDIIRVIGSLALVLGLLLMMRRFLMKRGGMMTRGGRPSGVLEVLARYPVARGQQLMILKMGRRLLLLHHAGDTMTPISEVTGNEEVAALLARIEAGTRPSRGDIGNGFNTMLDSFKRTNAPANANSTPRPATSNRSTTADDRVIDLTRSKRSGLGRLLSFGKAGR